MKRTVLIVCIIIIAVGSFVGGMLIRGRFMPKPTIVATTDVSEEKKKALFWTCSMHPQIRQPGSGKCPICAMDLIPVYGEEGKGEGAGGDLNLSERALKLAEIQVSPVERRSVTVETRMVGKVEYDERRVAYISAWIPGRIDALYIDYTGIVVEKGDPMVKLYSPDLFAAQEELFQAIQAAESLKNSSLKTMRETAVQTIDAVREKLRLLGLTLEQIEEIEQQDKPSDHVTIVAPISGVVVHKNAFEGIYVKTGTRIYTIVDLSNVWVKLDAYESDIMWIQDDQEIEFTTEAYPGEVFTGNVAFIDPVLNPRTRTVKVRVNVPNPDGKLKPEMFVRGIAHSTLGAEGNSEKEPSALPLVIPASAPMMTGKRAVVYVQIPGSRGSYDGREVVLGPRAGDYYVVLEGLEEGELVVINGAFKIDSAIQILAKTSMMNPEGGGAVPGHHHGDMPRPSSQQIEVEKTKTYDVADAFKKQTYNVLSAYFLIQESLSQDDLGASQQGARQLLESLSNVDMALLKGDAHMVWMKEEGILKKSSTSIAETEEITHARNSFADLSDSMIRVIKKLSVITPHAVVRFNCPMALDGKDADWLQKNNDIRNPFLGEAMLKCGEVIETIALGENRNTEGDDDE